MAEELKKSSAEGKKVLLIEDDMFLGDILLNHMLKQGIKATLLNTGENALENIKKNVPDVLLLDIYIPGMNGLDLLASIRKDEQLKDLKVIVVSNTDQQTERDRATSLGAKFMTKAVVTPGNIVSEIEAFLK